MFARTERPMTSPRRPIPLRAIPLALSALAVPGVGAFAAPSMLQDDTGLLLWLTPILPAFLLAYYRGWRGAALALAFGMASLAVANVVLLLTGVQAPGWPQMMALVVVYLVLTQGVAALAEVMERERGEAERLAFTDTLTGLPNRRHADDVLLRSFDAASRGGELSVVLFDLDRFKGVNDRFGHAVGDEVLRALGQLLWRHTRGMDLCARYGGEEFLAVLPGSELPAAEAFAERIRSAMAATALPCGVVTLSAGIAGYRKGMGGPETLLAEADQALYAAKEMGRDQIRCWTVTRDGSVLHGVTGTQCDRGGRILVVDDDEVVERSIARSLERMGYRALPAGGAAQALSLFDSEGDSIDVLLTDVVMPEMSGPTLVRRLARRGWNPKVLYMSGYLRGELEGLYRPRDPAGFMEKPLDLTALANLLESAGSRRPERTPA